MAEKLSVLFDLDLLLNDETLRCFVQLKPPSQGKGPGNQVGYFRIPKTKRLRCHIDKGAALLEKN